MCAPGFSFPKGPELLLSETCVRFIFIDLCSSGNNVVEIPKTGFQRSCSSRSQPCLVLQRTAEQSVGAAREIHISKVCRYCWCRQCFYGKDLFVIQ